MTLNTAQSNAVAILKGPLLVLAGAGTGKTRVVTYRIASLIRHGIRPNRILAVTFTNKAAKEMQHRIAELLPNQHNKNAKPETSTFHSLCVRILRRHITKLGYPHQFAIYDRGDQESLARQVLKEIKISDAALRPSEMLARISAWKSSGIDPQKDTGIIWSAKDHLTLLAYKRYQNALRTVGAVDFDDILLITEHLFRQFPDTLREESERFDHLLVDEYQDTNMSQYRIVKGLALPHRNLCVVGDDDQAIYGWRGADVQHILSFQRDWPDAKIVRLEENYRSTRQIIDWANRLIAFNTHRHGKKLISPISGESPTIIQCKDGETEAKTVIAKIKERLTLAKRQPRDIAILFRTNDQPRAFEMELRNAKIPYVLIGGQSFFDRKEVRDILSYLKVLNHPRDDISLLRILNTPPRGIGTTTIQKLTATAVAQKKPLWDLLGVGAEIVAELPGVERQGKVSDAIYSFRALIEEQQRALRRDFSVQNLKNFLSVIDYEREINRHYQDPHERSEHWDSVGEVLNAAAEYIRDAETPKLWEFLDNTTLSGTDFGNDKKRGLNQNAVVLMTLHAAKGLEFPEVFMVGMEEGILPHRRSVNDDDDSAVDEERRLCYVGLTRAKRRLTLTLALQRLKWGKMQPTVPSRFLYEVTGQAENPNYFRAIAGKTPQRKKTAAKTSPAKNKQ
ncbi:MAG: UvrD-helicase domain-containing protein [Planctomycetaceae bacterium]|jgi:DNA helicase-2/ATP-dependent DNA helicase PcrA|nr:UvrD-helicase domain-containing protein [Planctomycetaceae bacterium]